MRNPFLSPAMFACFDGESVDETIPVDTPAAEQPDALAVEEETPEPEPLTFTEADLEQRIAERLAAVESEWQAKLSAKDSEVATIRAAHDAHIIERSLSDAARDGDAFAPEQIEAILRPHLSMVSGKPTVTIGQFVMSPGEAVIWMKSQPSRFGNLFRSNVVGGLGGHSAAGGARAGKHIDVKSLNAEEYRKVRRENPGALGLGDY